MERVNCAYCDKELLIKNYLKKDHNFCSKEHYHLFMHEKFDREHTIICDNCGKPFVYKGGKTHYERTKNHYCSLACLTEGNRKYEERHNKSNKRYKIWCSLKRRAKKKGFEFNLALEDIPQIPEVCPVLGIPIIANDGISAPIDNSPSVDRIDSKKGYIKGNIRIISNRANRIKADATVDELRKVLEDYERIQGLH
ncbi:MAG: hypothetical protein J5725_12530 [Bacteroidales bacterium]|nr:hypothetical protein [Bacteroidales bacterium]